MVLNMFRGEYDKHLPRVIHKTNVYAGGKLERTTFGIEKLTGIVGAKKKRKNYSRTGVIIVFNHAALSLVWADYTKNVLFIPVFLGYVVVRRYYYQLAQHIWDNSLVAYLIWNWIDP